MNEMHTLQVNGQEFAVADAPARERLDSLEAGYRYLGTLKNDTGEGIKVLSLTEDSEGQRFACSDFLVFATLPPVGANKVTQLYIADEIYKKLIGFLPSGFHTTATRYLRLHLWHCAGGKWCVDGVYSDITNSVQATSGIMNTIRSVDVVGEKVDKLSFYTNINSVLCPNGTVVEIYGK